MAQIRLVGPRVSAMRAGELSSDDTNDGCHGNLDGVQPHDKAIISHVRVVVVCWGHFYQRTPSAFDNAVALCKDIVTGPYFNGLAQYGVGRGSIAGAGTIDDITPPKTLSEDEARDKLLGFLDTLPDRPAVNDTSLLYILFLPPETKPTISTGGDDFCGYHNWAKFNSESQDSDLFYAIIRTDGADRSSGEAFIKSVSYCVSHEIAEAVSSRDGRGYFLGACEISDLCEQTGTHNYPSPSSLTAGGWDVEQYWSEWDHNCVNGEDPISVRRFLQAVQSPGDLRALHTPVLNIEYIASRFR